MPTLAPSEFVAKAEARGFVFSLKPGGVVNVQPPAPEAMTDTVRAYVRKAKPLLVPLLEARHGTGEPLVEPSAESLPDLEALGLHGVMAHYATQSGLDYNPEHPEALLPDHPPVSAGRSMFAAWTARQVEGQQLFEIYPEVWHEFGELLEEPLDLAAVLAVSGGYVVTDRYAAGLDLLPDPPPWWPKTALPPHCTFLGDGQE